MDHWIALRSGKRFYYEHPEADSIDLDDIAHSLSLQCRFAGQVEVHWSVAQHSLLVADMVPPHLRLQALLHDATEAYVVDLPSPLKHLLPAYRDYEALAWKAICQRFDLPQELDPLVKEADQMACVYEHFALFPHPSYWDYYPKPDALETAKWVKRIVSEASEGTWIEKVEAKYHAAVRDALAARTP